MSKANEKALGELHGQLANILSDAIGRVYLDEEGNPTAPPAAILNVARQFLKDNKIEAVAAQGSPLSRLADLPVFDDDDNVMPIRKAI
jgi:hypothetical protein